MKKMIITLLIATVVFSSFMTAAAYADTEDKPIYVERQLLAADASFYSTDNAPQYQLLAFIKYATDKEVFYDWYNLDQGFDMLYKDRSYLISTYDVENILNYFSNDYFFLFNGCGIGGSIPFVVLDKNTNEIALNPEIEFENVGSKFYIDTWNLEKYFGLDFTLAGNNLIISMPVKFTKEAFLKGF